MISILVPLICRLYRVSIISEIGFRKLIVTRIIDATTTVWQLVYCCSLLFRARLETRCHRQFTSVVSRRRCREARHIPAGARQTSDLTQILR